MPTEMQTASDLSPAQRDRLKQAAKALLLNEDSEIDAPSEALVKFHSDPMPMARRFLSSLAWEPSVIEQTLGDESDYNKIIRVIGSALAAISVEVNEAMNLENYDFVDAEDKDKNIEKTKRAFVGALLDRAKTSAGGFAAPYLLAFSTFFSHGPDLNPELATEAVLRNTDETRMPDISIEEWRGIIAAESPWVTRLMESKGAHLTLEEAPGGDTSAIRLGWAASNTTR